MNRFCSVLAIALKLSLLFINAGVANAATYYLSPTGSDSNPGTLSAPFATLMKAHNLANPGDLIYLRGGTYLIKNGIRFTRSGSSGALIKILPYPGEKPVLDASGITTLDTWVIRLTGTASWWHIKGLEIKNNPQGGGFYLGNTSVNNNIIENNNIHHNGFKSEWAASGISVYGTPSNNLILNNDVHHNRDIDAGDADGISAGNLGLGNVYRGNRSWNNSDDGFDFFCVEDNKTCASVLLENNWAFDNGYDEYKNPVGNGNGFKLGGIRKLTTGKSGGHTLRNNLAWSNLENGFDDNLSSSTEAQSMPDKLYNNTSWNNKENFVFSQSIHTLVNNISFGTLGYLKTSFSNNSWSLPVTVTSSDFASLDDSCARGPRKTDGSLPDCPFLHLASGSDLINVGANVGLPYSGSAPDLGAYEFATSSSALPDVVVTSVAYNSTTGQFTSIVKNQGASATPVGVYVGVSYSVDGIDRTWGSVLGPLAAGASTSIGTGGDAYIIPSGTHTISVFADDVNRFAESNESNNKLSQTITIGAPADTIAPSTPSSLTTTVISTTQINLKWNASTDNVGVTGYQIERCQGVGCTSFAQIGTSTTNMFNNTGLLASTTYSYRVRAIDAAKNLSSYSNIMSTKTLTPLPDVVVTSLTYNSNTGIFTAVVKNQGTSATPSDKYIGVAYSVNGLDKTWGNVYGSLAAGASITIYTEGGPYFIPRGSYTINAYVDDVNRFTESNESNNQLSKNITIP